MQDARARATPLVLVLAVALILLGAGFAYYYSSTSSSSRELSSLSSLDSSLSQDLSSQTQSHQGSGGGNTVTVTSTVSVEQTVMETNTTTDIVTSEVTTTSFATATVTIGGTDFSQQTGTLSISSESGNGTLEIAVSDTGTDAISAILVTVPTGATPVSDLCTSSCPVQMLYNGNTVSSADLLPGGATASGSTATDEGQVGNSYQISIAITFADGSSETQTFYVTAASD